MKNRKTIFTALIALLVLMMGVNFDAEAQLGGLLNKAKNKANQNKEQKQRDEENAAMLLAIPQPNANESKAIFAIGNESVASWNPATNELTVTTTRGGNTPGSVYKIDPTTGKVTDNKGASKGSLKDSTIDSPNLGQLRLFVHKKWPGIITGYDVRADINGKSTRLGDVDQEQVNTIYFQGKGSVKMAKVNPLLVAYVFYGLMLTEKEIIVKQLGFDPDKTYTTAELEDMIEWNDQESIDKIIKYESSLPCAGFKDTHPEFKNCKVAAVGLKSNEWREVKETDNYGYANWFYVMSYWVVYELADGRNIVTFSAAREKSKYGDVISKQQTKTGDFHEVTDWQRK